MFQLITKQYQANNAAKRWKIQYSNNECIFRGNKKSTTIYDQLIDLGPTPKPEDVDNIIGNDSWTEVPKCEQCDKRTDAVIEVGEQPDWESRTCYLCTNCITDLYNFIQGSKDAIPRMDQRQENSNT